MQQPKSPREVSAPRSPIRVAPSVAREQEILLRALDCVVDDSEAIYVSGPITTGQRFLVWFVETGQLLAPDTAEYKSALQAQVVRANEQQLRSAAMEVRRRATVPVIEPSSLTVPSWEQADYHCFWKGVLKRFVSQMVVLDAWQYSVGCAIEFQHAVQQGIEVKSMAGEPIDAADGRRLILEAAEQIELKGRSWIQLMSVAERLRECVV